MNGICSYGVYVSAFCFFSCCFCYEISLLVFVFEGGGERCRVHEGGKGKKIEKSKKRKTA